MHVDPATTTTLTTIIAATAGAFASFFSTLFMRMPEIDRGVEIYEDE